MGGSWHWALGAEGGREGEGYQANTNLVRLCEDGGEIE